MQDNQAEKRAKETKNGEKQSQLEDQNNEDEELIETQQEDHEPDTLERLLENGRIKRKIPGTKPIRNVKRSASRRRNSEETQNIAYEADYRNSNNRR